MEGERHHRANGRGGRERPRCSGAPWSRFPPSAPYTNGRRSDYTDRVHFFRNAPRTHRNARSTRRKNPRVGGVSRRGPVRFLGHVAPTRGVGRTAGPLCTRKLHTEPSTAAPRRRGPSRRLPGPAARRQRRRALSASRLLPVCPSARAAVRRPRGLSLPRRVRTASRTGRGTGRDRRRGRRGGPAGRRGLPRRRGSGRPP